MLTESSPVTLRDPTPDLAEDLGQPLVTANAYCSGRLCEVVEKLLKPAWQEIQVRAPESHLWIMRYARGGEHLKIRIHGQLPSRPGILETLTLGQERYFSSLGADLPEVRHTRKGCPPIDLEDGDTEDHPDRTLLFTTYRRSHVVFGHEPYLSDSIYASLLTCCLVASTEIVLGHIRTNRNGQFPARPQRVLFLRGLAAAVSALFPVVGERIRYLLYHRDSLLRGLRNRSKKFFNPTRMTSDRAQAEMVKLVGLDTRWEELPARVDLWCRHLESLFHHLALVRRDPRYYIDLYAEDIAFPGLFKALHGFANQLGVDPLNEAFLSHLALSLFAEEEVFTRPMQMRPEFLHPPGSAPA